MDVRVDPSGFSEVDMVPLLYELNQALFAYLDAAVHDLYVSFFKCIVYHFLVFEGRDGASGVDYCSTDSNAIYGSEDQLLLDVGVLVDIEKQSVGFD